MQEPTPQQTTGFPTVNNYYCPPQSSGNPGFQVQSHQEFPSCQWSSGLCDCCNDVSNCFITCLCPCITFGKIAEILDRGSTSCGISGALYSLILCFTGFQFLYSCFYRSKLRSQYSLQESPCNDCLVHCFCESCALCQEYRELNLRGFDMSIGWHANVERQVRMLEEQGRISETLPPIVQGSMNR